MCKTLQKSVLTEAQSALPTEILEEFYKVAKRKLQEHEQVLFECQSALEPSLQGCKGYNWQATPG